ncbi:MAG: ATP-binding cassette domain-containing protein [Bacillota bacterium]
MSKILEMRNITKEFPGVRALDDVSFAVEEGEIHCLVGENGAGKSTLMKVLSGVYPHTSFKGEVLFYDEAQKFQSVNDSEALGIAIINQELALVPEIPVLENIFLGHEITHGRFIDWNETSRQAKQYLEKVGLSINPSVRTKSLNIGQRQLVEIAKALSKKAKVIIFDEPTSSLNDDESANLLKLIKQLKKEGITSIMISHKLKEVIDIADTATVLRDGKVITTLKSQKNEIKHGAMVKAMVGREISNVFPDHTNKSTEEIILEAKNINAYNVMSRRQVVKDASFKLKRGEVLGFAGLMGAGRTELALSVFGNPLGYNVSGEVFIDGKKIDFSHPKNVIDHGVAYVSEDRKGNGLILMQDVKENISLASLNKISHKMFIDRNKEIVDAERYRKQLNIKTPSVEQQVLNLSGGNQQKVSLAKWLYSEPKILILDEPTRGIDVGAKYEIYTLINKFVEQGLSIILISSELSEVINMSDRILVMNEGKVAGELSSEEATQEKIMTLAVE